MTRAWWLERRAWTDESAGQFLREVVLKKPRQWQCDGGVCVLEDGTIIRGRECSCAIATDAAPKPDRVPVLNPPNAWPGMQPDADELAESSLCASFYEGVPAEIGRKRLDEYLLQRAMQKGSQ